MINSWCGEAHPPHYDNMMKIFISKETHYIMGQSAIASIPSDVSEMPLIIFFGLTG
jgi:hypothetical protein